MLKEEIHKLKTEGSDLQSTIDNLRVDLSTNTKEFEAYRTLSEKEKKALEAQIAQLKEEMASGGDMLMEELALKKKDIQRLTEENENLRKDLTHKEREYDKLYLHSKATFDEKKEAESRVEHLKGLCGKYTEEIDCKLSCSVQSMTFNAHKTLAKTKLLEKNFQEILSLKSKINSLLEELRRFDGIVITSNLLSERSLTCDF